MTTFPTIAATAILTIGASLCFVSPTYAQSPAASAPVATPSAGEPGPMESGEPSVKALHQSCRADATAQGLKGLDRRKAVMACVVKQRPDLAAREQCRTDGFEKGLRKDDLKAFVEDCAKGRA